MSGEGVGLGLDQDGWIRQQRGREPYAAVREAVQNAMDAAEEPDASPPVDIDVRIGYGDGYVVVEDDYGPGVDDLRHFYKVFAGSKRDGPEQRGRFGRGAKELIAAADRTLVHTTGGTAVFTVEQDEDDGYFIDGELHTDVQADSGTYVFATNDDWDDGTLAAVHDYIDDILPPADASFSVEHVGRADADAPYTPQLTQRVAHDKPDPDPETTLRNVQLRTITYDETGENRFWRRTDVEVYRTEEGEGGVYEMEIPVTTDEAFPFIFNVQQRTPVAEQREMLSDRYRRRLLTALLQHDLDAFADDELSADYVTAALDRASLPDDVERRYIARRWDDPDRLLLETGETTEYARDRAEQMHDDLADILDATAGSRSDAVNDLLKRQVWTAEDWVQKRNREEQVAAVTPSPDQEAFLDFTRRELIHRSSVRGIGQMMAEIAGGEGRDSRAQHSDDTVQYNVLVDPWDEVTPERVGTALHEYGHHEADSDAHDEEWYKTVQTLAGEVIVDMYEELEHRRGVDGDDQLIQELEELRRENHELRSQLEDEQRGVTGRLRDRLGALTDYIRR